MRMYSNIVFALVLIATSFAEYKSYEGYKVFRASQKRVNDQKSFVEWRDNDLIELWGSQGDILDIMVKPEAVDVFENFLQAKNIEYEIGVENLEELLQKERDQQVLSHSRVARLDDQYREFSYFYNSSEIDDYIDYLQAAYPQTVEIEVIGESLEGRSIRCVKISASGRKVDGNRPIIFIDAGIHAREWATHMTVLQILQNLIEKTEEYSNLLDGIDWVVVPIVNPDGYHHTHKTDRLWRKNRRQITGSRCSGVDLNRNYGFRWTANNDYCSEIYSGEAPFSEPETIAIRSALETYRNSTKVYLSLHSYGNYVLYPWGYDRVKVDNWQEHEKVGHIFAKAAYATTTEKYSVGNAAILLYPAAGASDDYASSIGIEYSFTIEMTKGRYGFVLPANEISRVGKEIFAGIVAVANFVAEER